MNTEKLINQYGKYILILPILFIATGCGGGSSSTSQPDSPSSQSDSPSDQAKPSTVPSAFNLIDIVPSSSNVAFSWSKAAGATSYSLCLKDESKPSYCNEIASSSNQSLTIPNTGLIKNLTSTYFVKATNSLGTQFSNEKSLSPQGMTPLVQYIKALNTDSYDSFGRAVSLSSDGYTLVVGAPGEGSKGKGVNPNHHDDNSYDFSGAAYVYRYEEGRWKFEAYIKASNTGSVDDFGNSVSLSANGDTLAVGARLEDSNGKGVNSRQEDNNSLTDSGAVYVYRFKDGNWTQQAYIKASNSGLKDNFGTTLSLASDGNTLAVGATGEGSGGKGINSAMQDDNSAHGSGAVYLYRFSEDSWQQQAYIKSSNTDGHDFLVDQGDSFGSSVSISSDGNTLAVGASQEDSIGLGVNSAQQNDNSVLNSGAVYLFRFERGGWLQQAYIKASNTGNYDSFGESVSLSSDGNMLAVGASGEDSNGNGVNSGQQNNNSTLSAGAAYVFHFEGGSWVQQAYIKSSNTDNSDLFGSSVSLSSSGDTLSIGAPGEDSRSTGIDSNQQGDNSASVSGAVYLYRYEDGNWSQKNYIKGLNTDRYDQFGLSVSLSSDGNTLVTGAYAEDSKGEGVNSGFHNDNSKSQSGAVYIY